MPCVVHPFTKQDNAAAVVVDDYNDAGDDGVGNMLNAFLVRRPGAGKKERAHNKS